MKTKYYLIPIIAGLALLISGCTSVVGYNPSYLSVDAPRLNLAGKSLVVMSDNDAQWVYAGKPTSFTGGASTMTVPMGEITKQVAIRVFGAAFRDGADFRNRTGDVSGYRLIVQPKVGSFTYAYNQLKNFGFAITPTITMELRVQLSSADGRMLLEKTYSSGPTEGAAYAISGSPAEKINQLAHQTLFKLMTNAAEDARSAMGN
jgi:hypothetical protein